MGGGSHRVRRAARRHRRARRAHAQGHVAVRRRTRQPRRLRQFRRGAGADPLFLGPAGARQCRLDRRHGVRDLRRAAAGALQCHDRRSEPAGLGGKFLHRHAGAGRRDHGAAADLCVLPVRRAALCSRDLSLHAGDRVPDGVADSGVLRQARRQAGGARNGAAGVRHSSCCSSRCWSPIRGGCSRSARVLYLGSLPFGWMSYRDHERKSAAAAASAAPAEAPRPTGELPAAPIGHGEPPADPDRPARLN